ncbi:lanthionine synthetase LanC family protein [Streptomyces axinellae]|uniref:Subtilin biosynthesis protein spaC n=1 Tax=Streptomyces axinellae TaxID=552788 RepID=A0ABP6C3K8_9ACTN
MSQQALPDTSTRDRARAMAVRVAVEALDAWADRVRREHQEHEHRQLAQGAGRLAVRANEGRANGGRVDGGRADDARTGGGPVTPASSERPVVPASSERPVAPAPSERPVAPDPSERPVTPSPPDPAHLEHPGDPGVPVLARLLAEVGGPDERAVAARATAVWVRGAGRGPGHLGLYDGGLSGTLVGLRASAALHPGVGGVADRLHERLLDRPVGEPRRYGAVTFPDYDLILGPAGTLLALTTEGPEAGPRGGTEAGPGAGPGKAERACELAPFAAHLAALCDAAELPGLRAHYPGHALLGWLHGRINTGMGHGVAGVASALSAAVRRLGPRPELAGALVHICHWLRRESYEDARDIRTWSGAGLDDAPLLAGADARQAWCYGTPGVAWALWDAADALGDGETAGWAADAFTSLADGYHEGFHLFGDHPGDRLGLCHGAAGVLAVADAFHRHAALSAATELRARMLRHLLAAEDELRALGRERTGLLTGVGGALAAVLTSTGASGTWLPCLGLR